MTSSRVSKGGVLRTALWTLRQSRYKALAVAMALVACACVGAGTWQVFRYEQSVRQNGALTANAHAAPVALDTTLAPLVGHGATPDRFDIRYRTVTVTGHYLDRAPQFVRNQQIGGVNGFYVLSPVRTGDGVLLVVRGFVRDIGKATPAAVAAAPSGTVHLTARLQTTDTTDDHASALPHRELESINAEQQAARLGVPVYDAYATLGAHQPGTAGLTALPAPDLSNPAGGAYTWQHLAYIVQWYLFALLALAAPFVVARAEIREARRRYLGLDPGEDEIGLDPGPEGAAALEPGDDAEPGGELVLRGTGTIARRGESAQQRFERAARLADRYGRSFGPGINGPDDLATRPGRRAPVARTRSGYRASDDEYRAGYNDYLWELALADTADAAAHGDPAAGPSGGPPHVVPDEIEPTVIRRPDQPG